MSRIHEALKKEEQERAMSQPATRVETSQSVLEPSAEPAGIIATATSLSTFALGGAVTRESLLTGSRKTNWTPDPKTMLFFGGEEHGSGMEEFRTLRSRLYQAREKHPLSKLLVTSALPKEGKSFTAANLAQVIVRQHGRRALLIDADLRNPQLHNLLGAGSGPGLSEYLQSATDELSIIQRGPMENLFLISAGIDSRNAPELGSHGPMELLLSRLGTLFHSIIFASPPPLPL